MQFILLLLLLASVPLWSAPCLTNTVQSYLAAPACDLEAGGTFRLISFTSTYPNARGSMINVLPASQLFIGSQTWLGPGEITIGYEVALPKPQRDMRWEIRSLGYSVADGSAAVSASYSAPTYRSGTLQGTLDADCGTKIRTCADMLPPLAITDLAVVAITQTLTISGSDAKPGTLLICPMQRPIRPKGEVTLVRQ